MSLTVWSLSLLCFYNFPCLYCHFPLFLMSRSLVNQVHHVTQVHCLKVQVVFTETCKLQNALFKNPFELHDAPSAYMTLSVVLKFLLQFSWSTLWSKIFYGLNGYCFSALYHIYVVAKLRCEWRPSEVLSAWLLCCILD